MRHTLGQLPHRVVLIVALCLGREDWRAVTARRRAQWSSNQTCSLVFEPQAEPCPLRPAPNNTNRRVCPPDFFILGTRKGGTTSLYTYMTMHPAVLAANIRGKPTDGEVFAPLGSVKFRQAFHQIPHGQLVGESYVGHLVMDALNIWQLCGDKRLMALLREPVARCHSQMLMRARLRHNGLNLTTNLTAVIVEEVDEFEQWITDTADLDDLSPMAEVHTGHNCLYEGLYVVHLKRYFNFFDRDSIRLYWFDDFANHTVAVLRDALNFVGADPALADLDTVTQSRYNNNSVYYGAHPALILDPSLVRRMRQLVAPYNRALSDLLGTPLPPNWS